MNKKTITKLNDSQIEILTKCAVASSRKPVTKARLMSATGLDERAVRYNIQHLREMGYRICSTSTSNGYWIAKNDEDYKRFRADYVSRANEIFRIVRRMDKMNPNQLEMVV